MSRSKTPDKKPPLTVLHCRGGFFISFFELPGDTEASIFFRRECRGQQVYNDQFRAIKNPRDSYRFSRGVSALYTPAALPLFCLSEARKKGAAVFCDAFFISLLFGRFPYASTASYFSATFFQSSTSKNAFT